MVEQATWRCFIDYDARLYFVFDMAHDWLSATFLARWCFFFFRSRGGSSDKVKVCLLIVRAKKLKCCMSQQRPCGYQGRTKQHLARRAIAKSKRREPLTKTLG